MVVLIRAAEKRKLDDQNLQVPKNRTKDEIPCKMRRILKKKR